MKAPSSSPHPWEIVEATLTAAPALSPPDVAAMRAAHLDFVWLSLQRLGVRDADLEDALQEVFIVVHQRIAEFDGRAKVTTWLFAIAQRVAMSTRRRSRVQREQPSDELPDRPAGLESDPEHACSQRERREFLRAILDELEPDKRAVFVMFEIEAMECEAIADLLGVPVGTVYSRLHHARKCFEKAVLRVRARSRDRGGWR